MRVVLPGGTGQAGTILARAFVAQGAEVVALSREPEKAQLPPGARALPWDGATVGPWAEALEGADAVVNLAGRSGCGAPLGTSTPATQCAEGG